MKRFTIVLALVVPLLLAVGFAALYVPRPRVAGNERTMSERNMPKALGRHLERLSQAIPGQGGESEGPGSAEAEEFLALAYPDTDVPLARLVAARKAATTLKK